MLTGMTADGRRITLGRDGRPVLLNTPVIRDPETGDLTIIAADKAKLDAQTNKQRAKAEAAGEPFTPGEASPFEDDPAIVGGGEVWPGRWQRMAAKVALALLAEQQPAAWRRSASAESLREEIRVTRSVGEVRFEDASAFASFAAEPATAVVLHRTPRVLGVKVSLMGIHGIGFPLADDLDRTDWAWVSDPVDAQRSAQSSLGQVIYLRHRALGLL